MTFTGQPGELSGALLLLGARAGQAVPVAGQLAVTLIW